MGSRILLLLLLFSTLIFLSSCEQPKPEATPEQVTAPFFDPMPITYNNPVDVEINCLTNGATIYYTIDGSTPTTSATVYSAPIHIENNTVIKAYAVKSGNVDSSVITANYRMQVAPPIFDLAPIVYNNTQSLMMICTTDGAEIYYTTDGVDPTSSSLHYLAPIQVSQTSIIKAIGIKTGMTNSKIVERNYNFKAGTPQFNPLPGNFNYGISITLNCSSAGATIYYTTNGDEPTTSSTQYINGIAIAATTTIKAIADVNGMSPSDIATGTFVINLVSDPQFTPDGGTFNTAQPVNISCATSGVNIYYTTDGSTPTEASSLYTSDINISTSTTIKAKAFMPGGGASNIITKTFTITSSVDVGATLYTQRLLVIDIFSTVTFTNEDTKWLVTTIEPSQSGVYYLVWSDNAEGAGGDTVDAIVTLYESDKTTVAGSINAQNDGYTIPNSILLTAGNYYIKVTGNPAGTPVTGTCRIKLYR